MHTYENTIVALVEQKQSEKLDGDAELRQVWSSIQAVCKEIIDGSVNLLHQDPNSMVEILLVELNKGEEHMAS